MLLCGSGEQFNPKDEVIQFRLYCDVVEMSTMPPAPVKSVE